MKNEQVALARKLARIAKPSEGKRNLVQAVRETPTGIIVYKVYDRRGKPVWVTIPE